MIKESNISCFCIIVFIKSLRKRDKMLGKPRILAILPNSLINAIKHLTKFPKIGRNRAHVAVLLVTSVIVAKIKQTVRLKIAGSRCLSSSN